MVVCRTLSRRKRDEREHRQDQATPPPRGASAGVRRREASRPRPPPPSPSLWTRQATGRGRGVTPDPAPHKVTKDATSEGVSSCRLGSIACLSHVRLASPRLSSSSKLAGIFRGPNLSLTEDEKNARGRKS